MNKVIQGDCLEKLKDLEDNSVDSIVTDPPYELGFMGKSWDNTGIANNVEMWKECLRVLKPGGHLLAFSGTRTYHRMTSAIEDAGFEVRDMIEWVYGSGFPKSHNIGKAVDKLQGNEKFKEQEIGFVKWLKSNLDCYWCSGLGVISDNEEGFGDPSSCLDCNGKGKHTIEDIDGWLGTKAQAFHFFAESDSNRQIPNAETYKILKNRLHLDNRYDDFVKKHSLLLEEIRELQGYEKSIKNWDKKYDKAILNKPKTELASEWEGWGTALKPAHEPICMARKPLSEKTVAENCLKWGTGGINIDESRVESKPRLTGTLDKGEEIKAEPTSFKGSGTRKLQTGYDEKMLESNLGRFPANLIHDNSEEVRECFPDNIKGEIGRAGRKSGGNYEASSYKVGVVTETGFKDNGNASRFFKSIIYQAKASKAERNRGCEGLEDKIGGSMCANTGNTMDLGGASLKGEKKQIQKTKNNHPTVKPIALMEYLIKMVTPKGGIVLDPFAGSGTTGVACKNLNRNFIGIELDPEYFKIAEKRINENL